MNKLLHIFILLSGLMLSSCESLSDLDDDHASIAVIQGNITDTKGNPLEKIKVTISVNDEDFSSCYSSSEGQYRKEIIIQDLLDQIIMKVKFDDIDEEQNGGHFESHIVFVTINKEDFTQNTVIIDLPCRLTPSTL